MVSNEAAKNFPGLSGIGEVAQNIWVERGATAAARAKTLQQIQERQVLIKQGVCPQLNIFPEGATTNGKSIIKFKKGAFFSLDAVRPVVIRYKEMGGLSVAQDVCGILYSTLASVYTIGTTVQVDYLPVFQPNDFFWNNHWQEGKEEKWEAYARVVREIMAEHGGFKLSELTMQDKIEYKKLCKEQASKSVNATSSKSKPE